MSSKTVTVELPRPSPEQVLAGANVMQLAVQYIDASDEIARLRRIGPCTRPQTSFLGPTACCDSSAVKVESYCDSCKGRVAMPDAKARRTKVRRKLRNAVHKLREVAP